MAHPVSYFLFRDDLTSVLVREFAAGAEGSAAFPFFALHAAHRFRCASAMRFRAWGDSLGRRRRVTAPATAARTPAV
jgi:hypothetical protein